MARNSSYPLDVDNPLCGHATPLRHRLRRDPAEHLGEAGRPAGSRLGIFQRVIHESDESISFELLQAPLSMNERQAFGILSPMTSVGSRIREVRASFGMTQESFAGVLNAALKRAGRAPLTRAAVSNWERDQGIKNENQLLIADVFDISVDWLGTGRGKMRVGRLVNTYDPDVPDKIESESLLDHDALELARQAEARTLRAGDIVERDARGGMGLGGGAQMVVVDGKTVDDVRAVWNFPPDFIHAELRAREPDLDILPVYGDSMIPTLLPGDRVLVHRRETSPSPDGLFAIDDGVGTAIKRLQPVRGSDPLQIRIISDNPLHKEDIVLADQLRVLGRVICKLQRL